MVPFMGFWQRVTLFPGPDIQEYSWILRNPSRNIPGSPGSKGHDSMVSVVVNSYRDLQKNKNPEKAREERELVSRPAAGGSAGSRHDCHASVAQTPLQNRPASAPPRAPVAPAAAAVVLLARLDRCCARRGSARRAG